MTNDWTDSEFEKAKALRANGASTAEVAAALGRSIKAVQQKFIRETFTPEQKAARLEYERIRRRALRKPTNKIGGMSFERTLAAPLSPAMIERDRRLCAPARDLTAAFFGDPPVGFSALERRA